MSPSPYPDRETSRSSSTFILILVLVFGIGALYLSTIRFGHDWGGDNCMYILHARNIVQGTPYADTGYIPNPYAKIFPVTYPPVFPLLLAPVYKFYGLNLTAMKVELIFLFLIALLLMAHMMAKTLPRGFLLAWIATIGLNPGFWDFKDYVLSEIPFIFFIWMTFFLLSKAYAVLLGRKRMVYSALAGITVYLCYGTKAVGGLLLIALIIYHLFKVRRNHSIPLTVAGVFLPLLILQNIFVHNEIMHTFHKASDWSLGMVFSNITYNYPLILCSFWNNTYSLETTLVVTAGLTCVAVWGLWVRCRKGKWSVMDVFFIIYVSFFLMIRHNNIAPYHRYLFPIIPIYMYYIYEALMDLGARAPKFKMWFAIIPLIVISLSYGATYTRMQYGAYPGGLYRPEAVEMFDYIKTNTKPEDVIIFAEPRVMTLYTGRKTSHYLTFRKKQIPVETALEFFRNIRAGYWVMVGDLAEHFGFQDHLRKIFSNSIFTIYEIKS